MSKFDSRLNKLEGQIGSSKGMPPGLNFIQALGWANKNWAKTRTLSWWATTATRAREKLLAEYQADSNGNQVNSMEVSD